MLDERFAYFSHIEIKCKMAVLKGNVFLAHDVGPGQCRCAERLALACRV